MPASAPATKRAAVVIPVYNHASTVAAVTGGFWTRGIGDRVNAGSTDGTPQALASIGGITVLGHGKNMGKGAAILTGLEEAARFFDWAVTIDADGQHDPEDIPLLLATIPDGQRPIVVGSRHGMDAREVPWTSRFGGNFRTSGSGPPEAPRGGHPERLPGLSAAGDAASGVRARRFQFEVEVLARARWRDIPSGSPVRVIYPPGEQRISHYRPFMDFMRNS